MSFISYAQNREDVLLWRALGHIKNGFYIDVGANEPEQDSVTNAFYQRGWWGINIEPVPGLHRMLCEARPRDINLGIAAGAAAATITLYDLPEVNGWATASADIAAAHRADGHHVIEYAVPVRTLNDICAEHVRGPIHFLKIDVEGFEEDVLRGIDLARWRPWIVVVEATLPNSRATNHDRWDGLITAHDYRLAWFDGLNRYYVAAEQAGLAAALSTPPNVFDDFVPSQLDQAWRQLTELGQLHEAASLDAHNARAQAQIDATEHGALLREQKTLVRRAEAERDKAVAAIIEAVGAANTALRQAADQELRMRTAENDLATLRAAQVHDHAHLAELHAAHERAAAWGRDLEQALMAIRAHPLWRLAAPLRALNHLRGPLTKLAPRPIARRLALWAMRQPRLRQLALRLMRRYPALALRVRGTVAGLVKPVQAAAVVQYVPPPHLINVPVGARKVLDDLARESATLPPGQS